MFQQCLRQIVAPAATRLRNLCFQRIQIVFRLVAGGDADDEFDACQYRFRQGDIIFGAGSAKGLLQDRLHFQPYLGVVIVARYVYQA